MPKGRQTERRRKPSKHDGKHRTRIRSQGRLVPKVDERVAGYCTEQSS